LKEIHERKHTAWWRDGQEEAGHADVRAGASPRYHSYLLRCWSDGPGLWRFSVEDPHTGARRGFSAMATLVAFLEATLGAEEEAERDSGATPTDAPRP
jgi:hypothetical protein